MSLIYRQKNAVAIRLFRFRRFQIELVYAPKGEVIEPHIHKQIDGTFVIIGGEMEGKIGDRSGKTGWYDFGRRFKVPANCVHSATVTGRFILFLNFEKWTGDKLTSAAVDFHAI